MAYNIPSTFDNLVVFNGKIYFEGKDSNGDYGLWSTDGTAPDTVEIGGFGDAGVAGAGTAGLSPSYFIVDGSVLLFRGTDANGHLALWASDSTAAGTVEVGGLNNAGVVGAGVTGLSPGPMVVNNGEAAFNGTDADGHFGLWITNGTASGTTEVGGLNDAGVAGANAAGLQPYDISVWNNEYVFNGRDSSGDYGLWISDGTAAGTYELGGLGDAGVTGASAGLNPSSIVSLNGDLYFAGGDASGHLGLWVSDGTAVGTTEIGGLSDAGVAGAGAAAFQPTHLFAYNGEVLFNGINSSGVYSIWTTNGTAAGTSQIYELTGTNFAGTSWVVANGEVYFVAGFGYEEDQSALEATNGTTAGTYAIGGGNNSDVVGRGSAANFPFLNTALVAYNNEVFFSANSGLWESNGTGAGTTELLGPFATFVAGRIASGLQPVDTTPFNGGILFGGTDSRGDVGLWFASGASPAVEIGGLGDAGVTGAFTGGLANSVNAYAHPPLSIAVSGGKALFNGYDSNGQDTLWVTDGTAAGTVEVGGLNDKGVSGADPAGLQPYDIVASNGEFLFNAVATSGTPALWVSDGTAAGTSEIGGLNNAGVAAASQFSLSPEDFTPFNGQTLFSGLDSAGGSGLWATDGTAAGTTEIGGLDNGGVTGSYSGGLTPGNIVSYGGKALFAGTDSSGGVTAYDLWITDGTASGTTEIGGLNNAGVAGVADAAHGGLDPLDPVVFDNKVIFEGTDANDKRSLWVTDGTASGTVEIGGLAGITGAAVTGLNPTDFALYDGQVFFQGTDSSGHAGLWVTDGTAADTYEIGSVASSGIFGANALGLSPANIAAAEGDLLFSAEDANNRRDLWSLQAISATTGATTYSLAATPSSSASVSITPTGAVVLAGADDQIDLLQGYTSIVLADSAIAISGNVLTQSFASGASSISTYNIAGAPYTSDVDQYSSAGQLLSSTFGGLVGAAYSSVTLDYSPGGTLIGSNYDFTTASTGATYAGYECDLDGGQNLTRVDFKGVFGAGYTSYEYDYVGGVLAGSKYEVTNVPASATYSSYEVDFNQANAYTGDKFYFANVTGRSYTGAEEDFDAGGNLTRVLLTGVSGQSFSSIEQDYSAGAYTGYKVYSTGLSGAYTGLEADYDASNQLTKAVYSGMTSTPYSSLEQDYAGGALVDSIYSFTNASGGDSYAYQVEENAGGALMATTYDLDNGGHAIVGAQNNLTLAALGNDQIAGGGGGETFVLPAVYGQDTITDFSNYQSGVNHDVIAFAQSEFSNYAAVQGAAVYSNGNAIITDPGGDKLTLIGVTALTSQMSADFSFHA